MISFELPEGTRWRSVGNLASREALTITQENFGGIGIIRFYVVFVMILLSHS